MLILTEEFKKFIKKEAKLVYPNECCGLILKNGNIISCKNISFNPEYSFVIDNDEIFKYGKDNILAFYHSHKNDPEFSITDIAFSEKLQKNSILYSVDNNIFKEYSPNNARMPYEGRRFIVGVLDCITLIEDYYKYELNIILDKTITDPIRFDNEYWVSDQKIKEEDIYYSNIEKLQVLLKNYLLDNNFVIVEEAKKNDILVLQANYMKFPTHLIIVLDDNKVLTYINRISKIDSYRNIYKRATKYIFRHKSLI